MRAIVVTEPGGPDVLQLGTFDLEPLGPDDVHVRIAYAGVNFLDTHHRSGTYARPTPFVPGREGSGVVTAVGDAVEHVGVGDRVAFAMHSGGAYAEEAVVPSWKVARVPDEVDLQQAAALMLQGLTALSLVETEAQVGPQHTVLVHSAAGGTGSLVAQVAKQAGARVLGFASTPTKVEAAQSVGIDEASVYPDSGFATWVRERTSGHGVDVIFDAVGGPTFEQDLDSLAERGRLIIYGRTGGAFPDVNPARLADGCLSMTYSRLSYYIQGRDAYQGTATRLMDLAARGAIRPLDIHEYDLGDAARAHEAITSRSTVGKLVLVVADVEEHR